jgi:hypothetical protein
MMKFWACLARALQIRPSQWERVGGAIADPAHRVAHAAVTMSTAAPAAARRRSPSALRNPFLEVIVSVPSIPVTVCTLMICLGRAMSGLNAGRSET